MVEEELVVFFQTIQMFRHQKDKLLFRYQLLQDLIQLLLVGVVLELVHLVSLHHKLELKEVQLLLVQYLRLAVVVVVLVFLKVDLELLLVVLDMDPDPL